MSPTPSSTHLVLIPSYDSGALVLRTVQEALARWAPVWVVIDGSTDGTGEQLQQLAATEPNLRVLVLAVNRGKGAAVLHASVGAARGLHARTDDGRGRPASSQSHRGFHGGFAARAGSGGTRRAAVRCERPGAATPRSSHLELVGQPGDARRRCAGLAVRVSRLSARAADRCHAIAALDAPFRFRSRSGRAPGLGRSAAAEPAGAGRYLTPAEGGVSHFNYLRDNVLLTGMHVRLMVEFVLRLPLLLWRRRQPLSVTPE